ncbi:diaminopimelate decarboxylase [Halobacteriales archaeon QS_4_69_34]|nr:MAG: diaminopimelate decarboxylase [Halobacteriales archaeon QS_4_69_34]
MTAASPVAHDAAGQGAAGGPPVRRLADWSAARLRELADEYGTPLYVLDRDRVVANARRLRTAFPDAEIHYAVKANAVGAVLSALAGAGVGAECASAGEVERALDAGFAGEDVRYTAVNPPAADLDFVVGLGEDLTITVGARDTLDRLAERDWTGRLCVRVNPGVGAGHHAKVTTGAAPKFGVPIDRAAALAREASSRGFDVVGLHAHAGSGILEAFDAHHELARRLGDLTRAVEAGDAAGTGAGRYGGSDGIDLEFVSVGGGFGVPARPEESPLDLDGVAGTTREALGAVDARLAIEPGRYFVADAGVLLTRVNTVKPTPGTTVVGVDAGMGSLLRPALYDAHHEIRSLASDVADRETIGTTVTGPVCETADVLGRDRELPRPTRGDYLAVGTAGAYGYEMASTYNSRPRPAVVALGGETSGSDTDDRGAREDSTGGTARLAVRRETLDDLVRLER